MEKENVSKATIGAPYLAHWQLIGLLIVVVGSLSLLVIAVVGVTP